MSKKDEFVLSVGQAHELQLAMNRATRDWDKAHVHKLCHDDDLLYQVLELLRGNAKIVLVDEIIRFEESDPYDNDEPEDPQWFREYVYEEERFRDYSQYHLMNEVEYWVHDSQKELSDHPKASLIFEHLKETGMLYRALTLRHGRKIRAKGQEFCQKHFGDKDVLLWGSVARGKDGNLHVPALYAGGGFQQLRPQIIWVSLDDELTESSLSALFV